MFGAGTDWINRWSAGEFRYDWRSWLREEDCWSCIDCKFDLLHALQLSLIGQKDNLWKIDESFNLHFMQDTSEKMKVETFIWANKDDPDLYGEWDFEV